MLEVFARNIGNEECLSNRYLFSLQKMKKRKHKPKKVAYLQGWGTYTNQTLVLVGMSFNEILAHLKRIRADIEVAKEFAKSKEELVAYMEEKTAFTFSFDSLSLLWLPDWKNNWKHLDTLVHEVCHMVHSVLGKNKNMMDEDEARAYQTVFLFREIRRKLWRKTDP